jgi:hypothetical protein
VVGARPSDAASLGKRAPSPNETPCCRTCRGLAGLCSFVAVRALGWTSVTHCTPSKVGAMSGVRLRPARSRHHRRVPRVRHGPVFHEVISCPGAGHHDSFAPSGARNEREERVCASPTTGSAPPKRLRSTRGYSPEPHPGLPEAHAWSAARSWPSSPLYSRCALCFNFLARLATVCRVRLCSRKGLVLVQKQQGRLAAALR